MKKIAIILPLIAYLLCACEVDLPISDNQASGDASYIITSLVSVGENVNLRLARTESINEDRYEVYDNTEMLWRVLMFPDTTYYYYPEDKQLMQKYKETLVSRKSDVYLITSSGEIPMIYNDTTLNYECDYRPLPGEKLSVKAKCRSNEDTTSSQLTNECYASVVVPDWQPEFEIISANKIYKQSLMRDDLGIEEVTADSVVEFKIKIIDRSTDIHCYRIKVQGISYMDIPYENNTVTEYIRWCDAFFSSDPLLYDSAITGSFGPWQAYTTDVFTNSTFVSGEYDLIVQSRFFRYSTSGYRAIKITLQPISTSLANYLSTLYRIRSFTPSYFSEPASLSSNIDNGVGVFGAIGQSVSRIYFFPGEEQALESNWR